MTVDPWDEYAAEWDDDPAARAYAAAAFGSLLDVLDECGFDLGGSVVCDFGCGTGLMTERLVDRVDAFEIDVTGQTMRPLIGVGLVPRAPMSTPADQSSRHNMP